MLRCELSSTPALDAEVLGCIGFGPAAAAADPRQVRVALPHLGGPAFEIWRGRAPVTRGRDSGFAWASDGEVLFAATDFDADSGDLAPAAESTYKRVAAFTAQQGFPHLLRCWNWFDDIHRGAGDEERYRRFCIGRHAALAAPGFEQRLPAATVIGTPKGTRGQVVLLAARAAGVQVENPRQVPAFRYPREYSPRAPSFSRALLRREGDRAQLFVSGTASVVGHATRHPGDPLAQLGEIRANLDALLQAATAPRPWRAVALKLFVREASMLASVRTEYERLFGAAPTVFLQGDICREDLAVEIEGFYEA